MVDSYNKKCLQNASNCPLKNCGNFCDLGQDRLGWLVSSFEGVNYTYRQPVPKEAIDAGNSSTLFKAGLVRWDDTIYWLTLHQSSPGALSAQLWLSVDNGRHFTPLWTKPVCENCVERTQHVGWTEQAEASRFCATVAVSGALHGVGPTLTFLVDAGGCSWLWQEDVGSG